MPGESPNDTTRSKVDKKENSNSNESSKEVSLVFMSLSGSYRSTESDSDEEERISTSSRVDSLQAHHSAICSDAKLVEEDDKSEFWDSERLHCSGSFTCTNYGSIN